ncbi:MAG TPA: glycosyltransferase family 2 protein [Verrucomicrobiae bacterium]|nr:glycosyltransferase family 2 protein [Verrucomicrobiae bacterium]
MDKLPITVSMISGAEAGRIGRALESVAAWTSEIVVVLNEEVRDGTEEIAKRHGARVVREKWHGFRDQKNIALGLANEAWVLCLDADEEVSPELRESIRAFFKSDGCKKYAGAYFARKVWFLGRWIKHGDWYPDYSLRLFRRGEGRWGGSPEHDKIELNGPAEKLRGDLHHYTNPTINSYVQKINYFSDIFLQRQLEAKKRWFAAAVVLRSGWRFLRGYVLRLGFLDGFPGFFIAASTAYSTLVRHSRLYEHLHSDAPPCPPRKFH